jgi:hypothetical protein
MVSVFCFFLFSIFVSISNRCARKYAWKVRSEESVQERCVDVSGENDREDALTYVEG